MKKIYILLAVVFTIHLTFSQTIPIDGEYRDGGRGQYTFKIKGSITLGKGVFVKMEDGVYIEAYYPVSINNVQIISITTPKGTTYSNNDLVYQTNQSYSPNGIKLPINVSSNDALYHFDLEGLGYFENIETFFYHDNRHGNGINKFEYIHASASYDLLVGAKNKIENREDFLAAKGNSKEQDNILSKEYEKMFKSATKFPQINAIIFQPYGDTNYGNRDLQNLIQLASATESLQKNNSNKNNNSSSNTIDNNSSYTNSKDSNIDTTNNDPLNEANKKVEAIQAKTEVVGNTLGTELGNMFQNGANYQSFFNMSQSFYTLETKEGVIAGGATHLAGIGVGLAQQFKAQKDAKIKHTLTELEKNFSQLELKYKELEQAYSNNDYVNLLKINDELHELETRNMFNLFWLSRKAKPSKQYYDGYQQSKDQLIKRLNFIQDVETKLLIEKIKINNLNENEIIDEYLKLAHREFITTVKENESLKALRKLGSNAFYKTFTIGLIRGRFNRAENITKSISNEEFEYLGSNLIILEDFFASQMLDCLESKSCSDVLLNSFTSYVNYFNNLEYDQQKFILEKILYDVVPEYFTLGNYDKHKINDEQYLSVFYPMHIIKLLLEKEFKLNLYIEVTSKYTGKSIPFFEAVIEKNKNSDWGFLKSNKMNKVINEIIEKDEKLLNKTSIQLYGERKHLTQKQIEEMNN